MLDGKPHTVTRPLEAIAASLTPQSKLQLQLIGGSQVYGPVRGVAALQVSKAHLEIPTAGAVPARPGGDRRRRAAEGAHLQVTPPVRDPPPRPAEARRARACTSPASA